MGANPASASAGLRPQAGGNTVTLAIVQGNSPNPTATFSSALGPRRVHVGSGAQAEWKVYANGVEPVHAVLEWDGNVLWLCDAGTRAGTYLGIERIDVWRQIHDGHEIMLGQAALRATVVGPDAHPAHAPIEEHTDEPTATAQHPLAGNGNGHGFGEDDESTMVFTADQHGPLPSAPPSPVPAPAPQLRVVPQLPQTAAVVAPPKKVRSPTFAAPPSASMGMIPVASARTSSEETVITRLPDAPGEQPSRPPPAAGARYPSASLPPSEESVPTLMTRDLPPLPGMPPGMSSMGPGMPPGMPPMAPAMPAPMPMPMPMSVPPPAAPMGHDGSPDDPFGPMDIPPPPASAAAEPAKVSTSPRVLILTGVTLLAALALIFTGPPPAQTPAARGTPGVGPQGYRVTTTVAPPPTTNNILRLPLGPPGLVGVIVPAPPGRDAAGNALPLPAPNAADPIRQAAEAVAGHRYAEAIALYDALALQHPEAPLFQQFALLLRTKVARTCQPGTPGCVVAPAPPAPTPAAPTPTPAPAPMAAPAAPAVAPTPAPAAPAAPAAR